MKVLLDENFPLPLYHRLRAAGHDAEHIIVLGQRALEGFLKAKPAGRLFDLQETGEVIAWTIHESR